MSWHISCNHGYITNSSSVIHHFPAEALEHPRIKHLIEAMGVRQGFVGEKIWHRGHCATFAVTKEQKQLLQRKLDSINDNDHDWKFTVPQVDIESDDVVIVYGDEYDSLASFLAHEIQEFFSGACEDFN